MTYFTHLNIPAYPTAYKEIVALTEELNLQWTAGGQICINTTEDEPTNYMLGVGSLQKDWSAVQKSESGVVSVPIKQRILKESDFTQLCTQFHGTVLEDLYNELKSRYTLGRVRLMRSDPKTCLSWHTDRNKRVHYVIKTQPGCFMVVDTQVLYMPQNSWWHIDTTVPHTAFNGSMERRLHLVAEVL